MRVMLIMTAAMGVSMGNQSWSTEAPACNGQILCESEPALVDFNDDSRRPKLVKVVGIGLGNSSDENVALLVANATKACLAAKMPELKSCSKKCPAGCGESSVRRACKAVIVRGQERILDKERGSPEALARALESKLPGPYKGRSIVAETLATPYPCRIPGSRNCAEFQALGNEKCTAFLEKFRVGRDAWLDEIGARAKKLDDLVDWGKNEGRCKDGEGKYFTTVTDPECAADGSLKTPPRVIVRAECVNPARGFSITSRIHAVKTCEHPGAEAKPSAHIR